MFMCSITDCTRKGRFRKPKDLCQLHYRRWKNNGSFEARIPKPYLMSSGYLWITLLGGSRKKRTQMLYHRYIMEQHLGRKLDPVKEQVHHINHIKTDNRIENLVVVDRSEHITKYHHDSRKPLYDWENYNPPSSPICNIEECDNKQYSKGLCHSHYKSYWHYLRRKHNAIT